MALEPPGCFYQRGPVSSGATRQSHYRPLVSHNTNQQPSKATTQKPSKACSDYWASRGLALRKCYQDKSKPLASCCRIRPTCVDNHIPRVADIRTGPCSVFTIKVKKNQKRWTNNLITSYERKKIHALYTNLILRWNSEHILCWNHFRCSINFAGLDISKPVNTE